MSRLGLKPSYWEQPGVACMPCRGRGWVIVEDPASGAPSTQVVCPYCKGQKTTGWVMPNRVKGILRPRIRWILILIWATYNVWPSNHFAVHMALLIPVVVVLVLLWLRPTLWLKLSSRPRRQHAPGFTDNREKVALGIFAGVVAASDLFGKHRRGS